MAGRGGAATTALVASGVFGACVLFPWLTWVATPATRFVDSEVHTGLLGVPDGQESGNTPGGGDKECPGYVYVYALDDKFRHTTPQTPSLGEAIHSAALASPCRTSSPHHATLFIVPAFHSSPHTHAPFTCAGGVAALVAALEGEGEGAVSLLRRRGGADHVLVSGSGLSGRSGVCGSLWAHPLFRRAAKLSADGGKGSEGLALQADLPTFPNGFSVPYLTVGPVGACPGESRPVLVGLVATESSGALATAVEVKCKASAWCRSERSKDTSASVDLWRSSVFCLHLPWDFATNGHLIESMIQGCIPVLTHRDQDQLWPAHWGDWKDDAVIKAFHFSTERWNVLFKALENVDPATVAKMQATLARNVHKLVYENVLVDMAHCRGANNNTAGIAGDVTLRHLLRQSSATNHTTARPRRTHGLVFVAQADLGASATPPNFEQYKEHCQRLGGNLASLHSAEDQAEACRLCSKPWSAASRECYVGGVVAQSQVRGQRQTALRWVDGTAWDFTHLHVRAERSAEGTVLTLLDHELYGHAGCVWSTKRGSREAAKSVDGALCRVPLSSPWPHYIVRVHQQPSASDGGGCTGQGEGKGKEGEGEGEDEDDQAGSQDVPLGFADGGCVWLEHGHSLRVTPENEGATISVFDDLKCGKLLDRVHVTCDTRCAEPGKAGVLAGSWAAGERWSVRCTNGEEAGTAGAAGAMVGDQGSMPVPTPYPRRTTGCRAPRLDFVGDGFCDGGVYNTAACGFDGGDCCEATCVRREFPCGVNGYDCRAGGAQGCRTLLPASSLDVEAVVRRCPMYLPTDEPRYHLARACDSDTGDADDLRLTLANSGFRKCGDICVYSFTQEGVAWKWDNNNRCWIKVVEHRTLSCFDQERTEMSRRMQASLCPLQPALEETKAQLQRPQQPGRQLDADEGGQAEGEEEEGEGEGAAVEPEPEAKSEAKPEAGPELEWPPSPPKMHPGNLQFVRENLEPFRAVGGITWAMLDELMTKHPNTQVVCLVEGVWYFKCTPVSACGWPDFPHGQKILFMLTALYQRDVPDVCIAFNFDDEPRVRPGGVPPPARSPADASSSVCNTTGFHDSDVVDARIWDRIPERSHRIDSLVPLLSYTTAPALGYVDINFHNPNILHVWERDFKAVLAVPPPKQPPVHPGQCIWRGGQNGGPRELSFREGAPRSLLVHNARRVSGLDAKLVWTIFSGLQDYFKANNMSAKSIPMSTQFAEYECVLDICGWAWSARFRSLLLSHLTVLKVNSPFTDMFERALRPWVHYVPVCSDLSEAHLREAVEWFQHHPDEARRMSERATALVKEFGSPDALMDWTKVLLTEYAALQRFDPRELDLSDWFAFRVPITKEGRKVGGG